MTRITRIANSSMNASDDAPEKDPVEFASLGLGVLAVVVALVLRVVLMSSAEASTMPVSEPAPALETTDSIVVTEQRTESDGAYVFVRRVAG